MDIAYDYSGVYNALSDDAIRRLDEIHMLSPQNARGGVRLYSSGGEEAIAQMEALFHAAL